MNIPYLTQELRKEVELQYQHTDAFLKAAATTGKEREYRETVVLPAIEKDQAYQKKKVSQILEQTMKEKDEKWKVNPS